ncbi:amidase [Roseiterribacter gracilis]|uniref:Amidase n=1 Tax=Roseiterribacter gracilis TaxID=2812848 RepID=A0A8S8XCJ7_9PROT|nr:amidase [Rhodospirillales bacterium TMPK1]
MSDSENKATGPSRRVLLATAIATAANAPLAAAFGAEPKKAPPAAKAAAAPTPNKSGITDADLKGAAKLAQVEYSDAERAQLLSTFDDTLERARRLRTLNPPNDLAPAVIFDPRLPNRTYRTQRNNVRLPDASVPDLPADEESIAFASARTQAAWLQRGAITSAKLTELYLARIAKFAPSLDCFVTVTADVAREQAANADRERKAGKVRGPLHGLPYVLKDLADSANIRTTWGSTPYKDRVATQDATITIKLREAGAVLLGKTTLGEFASGEIWYGGITRNPWNRKEGSSGSSAGSAAAVAAGLASFGIGTETMGSIVSPSHRCGTTGLRPTFGRVSRAGCMALCWSLDKIGALARSVDDTALVLSVLNGRDDADASSIGWGLDIDATRDLRDMKIGFVPALFEKDATDVDRAALEAAKKLGAKMVEVTLPDQPWDLLRMQLEVEAAAAFERITLDHIDRTLRQQGDNAWGNTWRRARFASAVDYVQSQRFRRRAMELMDGVFSDVDAMIGPNFAGSMLVVTNFTGHPCLAMRAGFRDLATRPTPLDPPNNDPAAPKFRVPHAISLWAPLFEETALITVGRALEQALGVAQERPNLS